MKRLFAVFSFVLLFGVSAPALAQSDQTLSGDLMGILNDPGLEQATPEIAQRLDAYVAAHPDNGIGYALRCFVKEETALRAGADASKAFADCDKALELSPKSPIVFLAVGDALYDQGRFAESLVAYTKSVDLGQTDRGIFWKRCDAYRRTGQLDKALADCDREVGLNPHSFYAQYTRGRLQVARGQYAEALVNLNAAIAIKREANGLYWRGEANLALKNFPAAEADFSECIDLGDRSGDTYFARARARTALGRADAVNDYRSAASAFRTEGQTERAAEAERLAQGNSAPQPSSSPTGCRFNIDGNCFTSEEMARLFIGIKNAFDPKDTSVHVNIDLRDRSLMPAYEPEWHYVGFSIAKDGNPGITVWVLRGMPDARTVHAMEAGLILGLADSGYAGPKWKALYDAVAAKDAEQGPNAADPFRIRRNLADSLADLYTKIFGEGKMVPQ